LLCRRPSQGLSATLVCSRMPGLSASQRALCRAAPGATAAIGDGLRTALLECQHQFRAHRWNCTAAPAGKHLVPAGKRTSHVTKSRELIICSGNKDSPNQGTSPPTITALNQSGIVTSRAVYGGLYCKIKV